MRKWRVMAEGTRGVAIDPQAVVRHLADDRESDRVRQSAQNRHEPDVLPARVVVGMHIGMIRLRLLVHLLVNKRI